MGSIAWDNNIKFDEEMRPHMDAVYRSVCGDSIQILRSDRSKLDLWDDPNLNGQEGHLIYRDLYLSTDVCIRKPFGTLITGQEKNADAQYYKNLRMPVNFCKKSKVGDWFTLGSQWYFYGYATEKRDGYLHWYIFDTVRMLAAMEVLIMSRDYYAPSLIDVKDQFKDFGIEPHKNLLESGKVPEYLLFYIEILRKQDPNCILYESSK